MLDNVGKVKSKRNTNSKPYERPKSILRRVTDSVTGLLPQPSWLSSWLQSPPQDEEVEESEVEETPRPSTSVASERTETAPEGSQQRSSFIFRKPPGISQDQSNGRTTLHHIPLSAIPEASSQPGPSSQEMPLQTNGDDDSHSESTSGCSSLIPHPEHGRRDARDLDVPTAVEPLSINPTCLRRLGESLTKSLAADLKNNRGRKTLSLHTFSQDSSLLSPTDGFNKESGGASVSSMFDRDDVSSLNHSASNLSQSQSCSASKRPRFNLTSFGPSAAEGRKSFNESVVDSPFYAGRTTYGGASAYRRATLQPSASPFPYVRQRVYARPSSNTSAPSTTMNGSLPVGTTSNVVLSSSAQRILQALEAMSTPVRDAKRIPTSNTSRSSSVRDDEPSFTGYGLSRRRPNLGPPASKLSIGTQAQIVPRQQTKKTPSEAIASSTPIHSQGGGKLRSRISAPTRGPAPKALQEEEEEDVLLREAVPLGLKTLPSFSILPAPSSVPLPSVSKTQEIPQAKLSSTAPSSSGQAVASTTTSSPVTNRSPFVFAAPLVFVNPSAASAAISCKPQNFNFSSPLSVMRGSPKAHERPTAVEPAAGKSSFSETTTVGKSSRLEDELKKTPQATEPPSFKGFGDQFKPPQGSWTCSVCCVSNPKEKTRCVSCETACPTSVAASTLSTTLPTTSISTPTKGFGDQFKMPAGQWECPTCMVRNPETNDKCRSCEEIRPGSKPRSTPAAISSFKFGMQGNKDVAADSKFTFGMPGSTPSGDMTSSVSQESSEPKPGFQFGATIQPSDNDGQPREGFKFGTSVNQTSKLEGDSGFKFGTTVDQSNKLDGATGFQHGASLGNSSTTNHGGFKFGTSIENSQTVEGTKATVESTSTETRNENKGTGQGASVGFTSPSNQLPLSFNDPREQSKPSEEPKSQPLSDLPSGSLFTFKAASSSLATGATSAASTTAVKANPAFSFEKPPTGQEPGVQPSSLLVTGSVMDILGKKPEAAPVSNTGFPPVTAPFASNNVSSASTFPAVGDQPKSTFSFTKPTLPATTEAAPFSFGGLTSAPRPSGGQASATTSTATILQPTSTATPGTLSFGVPTTSTSPSQLQFKPVTNTAPVAAPSAPFTFNSGPASGLFGASTPAANPIAFGVPSTTTAAGLFTGSTPASTSVAFGVPSTTTTVAFGVPSTTTTAAASSTGMFSFGATSTLAPTTTAATSSTGMFSFGATSTLAPTTSTATSSTGMFSFGATSTLAPTTTTASNPSTGKFSFQPPTSTAAAPTAAPTFSFAAQSAAPPPYPGFGISSAGNPPPTTTSSLFTFGASGIASTPVTTPSTEAPKPSLFNFGGASVQQSATSTTAAPSFGSFGATPAKSAETSFSFGGSSGLSATSAFGGSSTPFGSTAFVAPAAAPPPSTFVFGAPTASAPPQAPAFSAVPNYSFANVAAPAAAVSAAPPGVFQFGNTPTANTGFPFNANSSFASTPSGPPPGGFGTPNPNPFDMGGAGASSRNQTDRKYRKAVRRGGR